MVLDERGRPRTRINRPKRTSDQVLIRNHDGLKECTWGEHWVPESWFSKNNKAQDGLHSYCRRCITLIKHNLKYSDYINLLQTQRNKCAICMCPLKFDAPLRRRPSIDHDHDCCSGTKSCGLCVRGILCFDCNNMIAFALENTQTLRNAIKYLEEWK